MVKTYVADVQENEYRKDTPAIIRKSTARTIVENGWVDEDSIEDRNGSASLEDMQKFVDDEYISLKATTTVETPTKISVKKDAFNYYTFNIDTSKVELEFK